MLHIVARGSKRGVLSPVFTLVSACEVFVFPWFPLLGFCGFCGSSGSCGSLFPPSSGSSLYANSNVFNWFSISDTSAGVAFGSVKIAFASSRSLVKPVSHWQNKKYPEVLRLQDTFLVRVAIQNFLKNPVISMVFGHPNRKISCISPHIRATVLRQPPFFTPKI